MFGDINWLRLHLKLTTGELKPLFDVLKEPLQHLPELYLIPDSCRALETVQQAIDDQFVTYLDYEKPLEYLICCTKFTPTALFWQKAPIMWAYFPSSSKVIYPYYSAVAKLIYLGRLEEKKYFGKSLMLFISLIIRNIRNGCLFTQNVSPLLVPITWEN